MPRGIEIFDTLNSGRYSPVIEKFHLQQNFKLSSIQPSFAPTFVKVRSAGRAEEYNDNDCFLIGLPTEILPCIQSLKDTIKFFMKLSTTCKKFNRLLRNSNVKEDFDRKKLN